MCGAHQTDTITAIKKALAGKEDAPVRVISTQLIEAGVDIDFPVVYRAVAGLDSVAQAAGRCNREGGKELGRFVVFVPESRPPAELQTAQDIGRHLLNEEVEDALSPERYRIFFEKYFDARGGDYFDKHGVEKLLTSRAFEFQFASAAKRFGMFDDEGRLPIIVNYGEAFQNVDRLLDERGEVRRWMRKLQRFTVQMHTRKHKQLCDLGFIRPLGDSCPHLFQQLATNLYQPDVGLVLSEERNGIAPVEDLIS